VFQSEMLAIKAAADMLLNNSIEDKRVVFHVDNQAALKTLNLTDITKKSCKETRESLNELGQLNKVSLEWVKAHDSIVGNKAADKLAKAGGCLTSVIGQGLLAKSAIKKELKEAMLAEWTLAWKSASEGRQTKIFWPEPDLKKSEQLIKLSRPMFGIMACFGSGFAFTRRQSAIIDQGRNPPMGVSPADDAERMMRPQFISYVTADHLSHRLDTIGVHQMPENGTLNSYNLRK
jgi:hypothetical protein